MAPACNVPHLDDTDFEQAIQTAAAPVLVHFAAGYCTDCGHVEHPLADVARWGADRLRCFCVDAGRCRQAASRYAVTQLPTVLLFRAGKVVRRFVGCPLFCEMEQILRVEISALARSRSPSKSQPEA
jgi:thioredoxin 1